MRVRFFSPSDEDESARYLELLAAIEDFWSVFVLSRAGSVERWLPQLRKGLKQLISPFSPGTLGIEFGLDQSGVKSLYILPLDDASAGPVAELIMQRAPVLVPWEFKVAREARPLVEILSEVLTDTSLNLKNARARVGVARGHLLEVVIAAESFHSSEDELALDAANRLVRGVVGDAAFNTWVGDVSIVPALPPRSPGSLRMINSQASELPLALSELVAAVEAAGQGIVAALPGAPFHAFCERAPWVLFELAELRDAQDAENVQALPDLVSVATMCPEMLKTFLSGAQLSSSRFGRHSEFFAYIQIKLVGDSAERLCQRDNLEETVNRMLVPGRIGCVVGSGLGTVYTYLILALAQPEQSVPLLRQAVETCRLGDAAWLRFCDDEWRAEWAALGTRLLALPDERPHRVE